MKGEHRPKLFGTNGVRGIFGQDLSLEFLIKVSRSLGSFFEKGPLLVGFDGRISSPVISKIVSAVLNSSGKDTSIAGLLPTPCLQYATKHWPTWQRRLLGHGIALEAVARRWLAWLRNQDAAGEFLHELGALARSTATGDLRGSTQILYRVLGHHEPPPRSRVSLNRNANSSCERVRRAIQQGE